MSDANPNPAPEPNPAPAPAADPNPAPAPSAVIVGDPNPQPEPAAPTTPADWPSDWRDKVAAQVKPGDAGFRERLNRFGSPAEVTKTWLAMETKLSSGEYRTIAPPKDAKPEQVAQWRKDNGVPEKPENYSTELPGGVKFDEDDKPVIDAYLKAAHQNNWTQEQVTQGLSQFHAAQREQADRLATFDTEHRQKSEDTLRAEWGADYRRNVNAVNNLIATMPAELAANFVEGRLKDGRLIGGHPDVIRWLSALAADFPTLVSEGGDVASSQESRLSELRALVKDRRSAYYKGPDAQNLQNEYRNLLDAQARRKQRAA